MFESAAEMEDELNARSVALGRSPVFFTRFGRPMREAIGPAQDTFPMFRDGPGEDGCDEGVCFV